MKCKIELDGSLIITPDTAAECIVLKQMVENGVLDGDTVIIDTSKVSDDEEEEPASKSTFDDEMLKKVIEDLSKIPQKPWPDPMIPINPGMPDPFPTWPHTTRPYTTGWIGPNPFTSTVKRDLLGDIKTTQTA